MTKFEGEELLGSVLPCDIIGLVEAHDDYISVPGYKIVQYNRPKSVKANQFTGGIAVLKAALTEVRPHTFLILLYFYICSILFPRGCYYHATRTKLYKGHTRSIY